MRRLSVYLTLIVLLAVALAAGYIASDWPHFCRSVGGCPAEGWTAPRR
jgi:hypothetical protein